MALKPSEAKIDDVENKAQENLNEGISAFPGDSYEAGVVAAIRWMRGEEELNPMDE